MRRERRRDLSARVYAALLAAYPARFRREYGREMAVVFADRRREGKGRGALARVWCETLLDLLRTAPREHLDNLREGGRLMRVLRTAALALVAYAFALLVVAPLYVRNLHAMPGFVNSLIDAGIANGVLFNLVFLVLTLTGLRAGERAVRAALVVTAVIVASLITVMMLTGGPPAYASLNVVVAQVLTLLGWFLVHLWWVRRKNQPRPTAA